MRYSGLFGVLSMIAVACAVQNNPLPDAPTDETGSDSGSGGSHASGGKSASGGSVSNQAGTTSGGVTGQGGTLANKAGEGGSGGSGGSGGKANGGSAGKASGGSAGSAGSGGKGSGGSAGTGGKGGSGGMSGSGNGGGGSGSGGSNCTPSTSGPIGGLSARYQSEKSAASATAIGGQLQLYNAGPSTLNLTDLKVRYYFTNEVQATINTNVNWAWYKPTNNSSQEDKTPKINLSVVALTCKSASADSYLEITFTADAGLLEAAHYLHFSWTAQNTASQNFTQGNDYSFDAAAKIDADDTKVVILQNSGTRVWGTEP